MYTTIQKSVIAKIFLSFFFLRSVLLTKAEFIWSKYSKNKNIVNYYYSSN